MDALSEILKAIHLQGAVFLDADLREGWSYLTPPPQLIGELHMPGAEHIIPYHLITSGSCHAGPVGSELVAVEAGDLIVFPHGDRHILASASAVDREPTEIAADMLPGVLGAHGEDAAIGLDQREKHRQADQRAQLHHLEDAERARGLAAGDHHHGHAGEPSRHPCRCFQEGRRQMRVSQCPCCRTACS